MIFCSVEIPNIAQQQDILPRVIPNSPTSAELGRFGAVPVGLFTGTAQINIPLYELKTNNLSLPITLNYSSNGLKVDKVASWVGMDWSLEAGGVINRIVKGKPDDKFPLVNYPDGLRDSLKWVEFVQNNKPNDTENDIYVYSFPGGTGKFIFDYNGNAITIPSEKLKISKNSNYTSFTITKLDGTQYIFSAVEYSVCLNGDCGYGEIPVSWYLSQIISPTKEKINFYYSAPYFIEYYSGLYQAVSALEPGSVPPNCQFDASSTENDHRAKGIGTKSHTVHLDSIVSAGFGKILFNSSKDRLDLVDDYKLNSIDIYNFKNEKIKSIEFNYTYPKGLVIYTDEFDGQLYSPHYNELKYRLFLSKLHILNPAKTDSLKYSFEYNNLDTIPPRLSFAQDHWGYFNGKQTNSSFFPTNDAGMSSNLRLAEIISNNNYRCSREPDGKYSFHGMLEKVTYPTNGYTVFEYEPNIASEKEYGGNRVARTLDYSSENSTPGITRYFYNNYLSLNSSSGNCHSILSYSKKYSLGEQNCKMESFTGTRIVYYTPEYDSEVSSSLFSLYSNGNYHIVYPVVTISHGDNFENGGEEHKFMDVQDENAINFNYLGQNIIPIPQSNLGWATGKKINEKYLKNINGTLKVIKEVNYNYKTDELRNKQVIKNLAFQYARTIPDGTIVDENSYAQCYDVMEYKLYSEWMPLISKVTKIYDGNGLNPLIETENFQYENEYHQLLTRHSLIESSGIKQITKSRYAGDYTFILKQSCVDDYTSSKTLNFNKYSQSIYQCYMDSVNCVNNCNLISDPEARNTCLYSCRREICRQNALITFISDTINCYNSYIECQGLNSDTEPIFSLKSAYQLSKPVEEQTLESKGDSVKLISGKFTKYKLVNENIVPDSIFMLNTDFPLNDTLISTLENNKLKYNSHYEAVVKFDKFDSGGNILEYHKVDNIRTSFYWGYSNTLPVIKAENVTYDELKEAVFLSNGNFQKLLDDIGELTSENQKNIWSNFNTNLIGNLPTGSFVTTYTYKPLIGITSQTDPNGQTTYYEYDDSGRLKCIKDNNGNILKTYEYHYQQ